MNQSLRAHDSAKGRKRCPLVTGNRTPAAPASAGDRVERNVPRAPRPPGGAPQGEVSQRLRRLRYARSKSSVDLLARDCDSNRPVIIENQLAATDHTTAWEAPHLCRRLQFGRNCVAGAGQERGVCGRIPGHRATAAVHALWALELSSPPRCPRATPRPGEAPPRGAPSAEEVGAGILGPLRIPKFPGRPPGECRASMPQGIRLSRARSEGGGGASSEAPSIPTSGVDAGRHGAVSKRSKPESPSI